MSWIFSLETVLLLLVWSITLIFVGDLSLNWRKRFIWPKVSETTWQIAFTSIYLSLGALACFIVCLVFLKAPWHAAFMIPVILLGFLGWHILAYPLTIVKSEPAEVALLTFWGGRQLVLLPEGEYKLLDFFPFKLGITTATKRTIPIDFVFDSVPCKSETSEDGKGVGAFVVLRVVGNIEADHMLDEKDARENAANPTEGARRIINFLDKGGNNGIVNGVLTDWRQNDVLKTLNGIIGEDVREHAKSYTWEEYMGLKAPLAATLVARISTARPRKLPRNADGVVEMPKPGKYKPDEYQNLPIIDQPLVYVCKANNSSDEEKAERRNRIVEMEFFLDMIREGGFADVPDLGIQFTRFTIPEIEPVGAVKEAAEKAAAETKQREQEVADTDAEIALAGQYMAKDPKMTLTEALSYVRLRRNTGTKEVFIRGSNSPLVDAAAIIADNKG